MKQGSRIRIGSMRVRVPGASKEAGRALAQGLCEQLGHLAVGSAAAHFGVLRLRIAGSPGLDARATSNAIATTISSKLTRTHA
jgi:hypothetical protein